MSNIHDLERETLAKRIAGEIVLSNSPGDTIKKWRTLLKIPQKELAQKMNIGSSVISDYESGRRKSPGIVMIKKIVDIMLEIEKSNGSCFIKETSPHSESIVNAIIDMKEFAEPVEIKR